MSLKTLVTVNAVVGLAFGAALLLVPGFVLATYGLATENTTLLFARLLSVGFLGFNTASFLLRNQVDDRRIGRSLVIARCLSEGGGFVVSLLGKLAGLGNNLVWTIVAIYGLFALGYLYFLARGQSAYQKA
jgi:hypothetical protein